MWLAPFSSRRCCYAAEQGYAIAQHNLGVIYANGWGVLQDAVLAHMWYNIGGANGCVHGSRSCGESGRRPAPTRGKEQTVFR